MHAENGKTIVTLEKLDDPDSLPSFCLHLVQLKELINAVKLERRQAFKDCLYEKF